MKIYFIECNLMTTILNRNSLHKAKMLIQPMLRNPVSQLVISFVVGYYATTKIVKLIKHMRDDDDDNEQDAAAKKAPQNDTQPTEENFEIVVEEKQMVRLTPQQLMCYDGFNEERPIYTALNGKIYDLSVARKLFQPSGPYSLLAGCDANKVLNIACSHMDVSTEEFIHIWEQNLIAEYDVVGYLVDKDKDKDEQHEELEELENKIEVVNVK